MWIFIVLLLPQVNSEFMMMIAYGEPDSVINSNTVTLSWDDCVSECLDNSLCMVAYQLDDVKCEMFAIGQINTATRLSTGNFIAIKVFSDSTICPAEISGNGYGNDNSTGYYKFYTVSYSEPTWTFNSSSYFKCPTDFTMFTRPLGLWCIRVIYIDDCFTQATAASKCSTMYGAQLSGLETMDEYNWALARAQNIWQWKSNSSLLQFGFWLDGSRKSTCQYPTDTKSATCNGTNEFTFKDPTLSTVPQGYSWLFKQPDSLTTGQAGDCIALKIQNSTSFGMDDCSCDSTGKMTGPTCFTGMICGLRPSSV